MHENKEQIIAGTCLLLSISKADNIIDNEEIKIIHEIICDFFNIDDVFADSIISESFDILNDSTDIFEFGKTINKNFTYQDKIDFICCTFEVAFADKSIHYLEEHIIKKISNILNVEHADIIKSKNEMKQYLNIK